jgi:hypothetical protein
MAKQRWATFSVEDHKFIKQLIPDILSFDRLIFPYPADDKEWQDWVKNGWDPKLLDTRLTQLGDLATPFEWGNPQRAQFRTRLAAAHKPDELQVTFMHTYAGYEEDTGKSRWEFSKQATRDTIGAAIKRQHGDDCWLLPRYGSLGALQAERSFVINPEERERRRARLTVLLGHELALPSSANAEKAYDLAIELANDGAFRHARRALNSKQEMTVLQEQSGKNDAQEFADLVADFNAKVTARTKDIEKHWIFTLIKTAKELGEIWEKPFSALFGAALEVTETATEENGGPPGPIAVFHHTKKRVFDPARV